LQFARVDDDYGGIQSPSLAESSLLEAWLPLQIQ
jgi:hypothetical protein